MADMEKAPLLPHGALADPSATPAEAYAHAHEQFDLARQSFAEASAALDVAWRRTRQGVILTWVHNTVVCCILGLGFFLLCLLFATFVDDDTTGEGMPSPIGLGGKVPLEAHIMSKCPDARDCLRDLVLPAMIEVAPLVDFKLSYIGKPTDHDGGVECMHGPAECLGNILELCAEDIYSDPKLYLGFTMCMTKSYMEVPAKVLVQDCALEHGISFDKLNACASDDGGKGLELLRQSVERSMDVNVTTSCTVRVDEKVWCVRDGGEWKDCPGGSDVGGLVKEVKRLAGR